MLQDPFLNALRKEHVRCPSTRQRHQAQGQIESFDQYVGAAQEHRHADGLQARDLDGRAVAAGVDAAPRPRTPTDGHRPRRPAGNAPGALAAAPGRPRMNRSPGRRRSARHRRARSVRNGTTRDRTSSCRSPLRRRDRSVASPAGARPDPALFAGRGKVDEVEGACADGGRRGRDLRPRAVRRAAAQPRGRRSPAASSTASSPHPRHLRAARAAPRASCRSSSRSSRTCRRGWSAAGRTSSGRRAASACAVPARRSSRPTAGC